jgi:hypothetical protein
VTEGSTFAFFIPVRLSPLPLHHEAITGAMQVHHSLKDLTIALSGNSLANSTHETGVSNPITTLSRTRRASNGLTENAIIQVLLVEDNEISQKLLKKQLVRSGCSVLTANDGVEAVEFWLKNADHNGSGTEDSENNNPRIDLILMGE